ncbi:carbon-nitrogen hydrolase [Nocardia otitidiscaviarum]|uniref:Carbon-nitrogen hydrolase n=1 Tax=Nocardia otitidiscaviarum TaxID=1823 RepID=A0A516NM50_9NOCA|nr:nitrilase-related carbon-nitrogen hydrolase [Nocardia otitidiscaviarum]MCP9624890.1 carbon-nitrogen hydrolase [Nocardia otitidiscaviarum]QDP79969.1 carbon-nitrogen hydrolase [Nocardia otitidiscaviarum]
MTRVAAAQFAVGTDVADNLATCVRMIDAAADTGAELVVLPEFCNHLSWYDDRAHAYRMACRLGDSFLTTTADRAARHGIFVKIGVTLAHPDGRTTGASLLFGPAGELLGRADKQILMGAENDYLEVGREDSPVIETALGCLGMYACMEGVVNEVTRSLAVRGARVLLNSLNSFAVDEAALHIPVRAAENKVWVIAANKVGPLLPVDRLPEIAARLGVPPDRLDGAGESQIVAPDGTCVAKAPPRGEAVIVADIEIARADDKRRPDGTDVLAARRPDLYRPLLTAPAARQAPTGAAAVTAAVARPDHDTVRALATADAQLIVLPELAALPVPALVDALRDTTAHAVTTVREGVAHHGLLVNADGVVARQPQLHATARHPWLTAPGSALTVIELPWGRLALVVGDDALFPETFRLAAVQDADVVAVCHTPAEPWEARLGLPERAAENRLNVVAAGLDDSGALTGGIYALSPDFTLWTVWEGPFAGVISHPDITPVPAGATSVRARIRPAQAANRLVSRGTDLVADRPRQPFDSLPVP